MASPLECLPDTPPELSPVVLADWSQVCVRTRVMVAEYMRRAEEDHGRIIKRLAELRELRALRKAQCHETVRHGATLR